MASQLDEHQDQYDEIILSMLEAHTQVEVEVKRTLNELLLNGRKVDQTLRLTLTEELETMWAELMANKNRILQIKPVFLELWRRVEATLEEANGRRPRSVYSLTKMYQTLAKLYRQLLFE